MNEPGDVYWQAIEPLWDSVSIYDGPDVFLEQFRVLSPSQQHLLAAHWCQSEVCNGGLHQFFMSPTGVLAPEALEGFRAIGLPEAANIVAEAMAHFGSSYPREQSDRIAILEAIPGEGPSEWDPFAELDRRMYSVFSTPSDAFAIAADFYAASSTRWR